MVQTVQQRSNTRYLPAAVFMLSAVFLGCLLSTVRPGVFFSGDGGLKYLIVQQTGPRGEFTSLHLEAPVWVKEIWNKGFYPFAAPFVYDRGTQKLISFPPFFQQLSSPFYKAFGMAGLYIIPSVSLLLLWGGFWLLLRRMGVTGRATAAALSVLTFCSPLTLYGAVFWEHSLSATLFFCGVCFLMRPNRTPVAALVLGVLAGFSGWLRPEALLSGIGLTGAVLYNQYRQPTKANLFFLAGIIISMLGFVLYNELVYGSPGGAHSYQLAMGLNLFGTISLSITFLLHMALRLVMYFPVSLIVFAVLLRRKVLPRAASQLLVISGGFMLLTPFLIPNAGGMQWGPRYWLLLIPTLLVAGMEAWAGHDYRPQLIQKGRWILLPVIIYSALFSTWGAYHSLHDNYSYRIKPSLEYLQRDPCKTIVVQNQYIAMELASLFPAKQIFRAEKGEDAQQLQNLLRSASIREAIFVEPEGAHESLMPCSYNSGPAAAPVLHLGSYQLSKCRW